MARRSKNRKTISATVGGRTVNIKQGSKAEQKYKAQGATFGAKSYERSNYLKSLNDPSSSNYVDPETGLQNGKPFYGQSITPESLTPTQPFTIPPKETPNNLMGTIQGGNSALASSMATSGYSQNENGQFVREPAQSPDQAETDYFKKAKDIIGQYKDAPNQEDIYQDAERDVGLEQKQKVVQSYTNQLNAITAKAQADTLSVTGQGRGIPEVIIGGQQAQIAKEAAIQALPVQAQLAAAQGDLEFAQSRLDTLFKMRLSDAEAKTNRWNKIVDLNYDLFNKAEQRRLDTLKEERSANRASNTDAVNYTQQLALQALENGNTAAYQGLVSLTPPDTSSKTYAKDLAAFNKEVAKYGGMIKSPTAALDMDIKRAQLRKLQSESAVAPEGNSLSATVLENPDLYKTLSAKTKEELIPVLAAQGFKFPKELTATQQESQLKAEGALLAIGELEKEIFDDNGNIRRGNLIAAASGIGNLAFQRREVKDILARIRTGATLNDQELAFYAAQVPRSFDDKVTIDKKLTQLKALYSGIAGSPVTVQSPEGDLYIYDDLFNSEGRRELREAITNGYNIVGY